MIDNVSGDEAISSLFAEKYEDIYNSVSYDDSEYSRLLDNLNTRIINSCCQNKECKSKHYISKADVSLAILKLKPGKTDCQLQSEHLKNGSELLFNHISNLLSSMLLHAYIPVDILTSTILPIPKDRKKSLHDSSNYRGIALNSLLGKILDHIILTNYKNVFQTSDRQFGFKAKHPTVQCTFVVKETLQYYITRGSSPLLLLLDACKAFDRVNYVKLFNLLIKKGICPLVAGLLGVMYNKQQAQIKCSLSRHAYSYYFFLYLSLFLNIVCNIIYNLDYYIDI